MNKAWMAIGFAGQVVFSLRFLIQWLVSEKRGESVIPVAFWYISLMGTTILFAYASYRRDPVFMVGQGFGFVVYIRNLMLIYKKRASLKSEGNPPS
jgi:lipid-A-disaccharide synthase-like uncharacterized protein